MIEEQTATITDLSTTVERQSALIQHVTSENRVNRNYRRFRITFHEEGELPINTMYVTSVL